VQRITQNPDIYIATRCAPERCCCLQAQVAGPQRQRARHRQHGTESSPQIAAVGVYGDGGARAVIFDCQWHAPTRATCTPIHLRARELGKSSGHAWRVGLENGLRILSSVWNRALMALLTQTFALRLPKGRLAAARVRTLYHMHQGSGFTPPIAVSTIVVFTCHAYSRPSPYDLSHTQTMHTHRQSKREENIPKAAGAGKSR
jgi:hypothetical protein